MSEELDSMTEEDFLNLDLTPLTNAHVKALGWGRAVHQMIEAQLATQDIPPERLAEFRAGAEAYDTAAKAAILLSCAVAKHHAIGEAIKAALGSDLDAVFAADETKH